MSKDIILKYEDLIWNQKKTDHMAQFFSSDPKIHSPLGDYKSVEEIKQIVEKWIEAIDNLKVRNISLTQEEGLVTSHWEATGVFKKNINGIKASNKPVKYRGVTLYRFKGDRINEYWAYIDSSSLKN
ncbi:MAG: hypothetical protein S4CHLAM6_12440 [Chlamydiae bacterium]|nr:hypothetical protein [Chlamydiota bacterium]